MTSSPRVNRYPGGRKKKKNDGIPEMKVDHRSLICSQGLVFFLRILGLLAVINKKTISNPFFGLAVVFLSSPSKQFILDGIR